MLQFTEFVNNIIDKNREKSTRIQSIQKPIMNRNDWTKWAMYGDYSNPALMKTTYRRTITDKPCQIWPAKEKELM